MKRIRLFLALGLCLVCAAGHAQWQWVDKDGRKVFSDRAPPPDIPAKSILKQPGGSSRSVAAPVAAAPSVAGTPAAAASAAPAAEGLALGVPRLSGVDKELAEKKKQAEAAAMAKTKADEERVLKAKADNCERAKANKALMDSGVRVSHTKPNGEREILDDAGRAAELKRIQVVMETNCK
jgi:hypothetical protein